LEPCLGADTVVHVTGNYTIVGARITIDRSGKISDTGKKFKVDEEGEDGLSTRDNIPLKKLNGTLVQTKANAELLFHQRSRGADRVGLGVAEGAVDPVHQDGHSPHREEDPVLGGSDDPAAAVFGSGHVERSCCRRGLSIGASAR
jgi:hypothetical protein